jgi:hypothetical protein
MLAAALTLLPVPIDLTFAKQVLGGLTAVTGRSYRRMAIEYLSFKMC